MFLFLSLIYTHYLPPALVNYISPISVTFSFALSLSLSHYFSLSLSPPSLTFSLSQTFLLFLYPCLIQHSWMCAQRYNKQMLTRPTITNCTTKNIKKFYTTFIFL